MSKVYQYWYTFDMTEVGEGGRRATIREVLRELSHDNRGFVTTADAVELGIARVELVKLARRGALESIAYGVYRIPEVPRTPEDQYTEATLRAGESSFLRGESVLALLGLADVNPSKITVGVRKRVRRTQPTWLELSAAEESTRTTLYDGIRAQRVSDAILECRGRVPMERLREAAHRARVEGWITTTEWNRIEQELPA